MVDRKKTFYGYDYTLCDYSHCPNCNNCVRYLTHLKAVEENEDYLTYNASDSTDDCDLFIDAEKWAHRFDADNDEFEYGHNVSHKAINEED